MLSEQAIIRSLLSIVACDEDIVRSCLEADAAFFSERLLSGLDPDKSYEEDELEIADVMREVVIRAGFAQMTPVFVSPRAVGEHGFQFSAGPDSVSLGDAYERLKKGEVVGGNLWTLTGDWAEVFHLSGRMLVPVRMVHLSRKDAEE